MAHNTDVFSAILEIKTLHSTTRTHAESIGKSLLLMRNDL